MGKNLVSGPIFATLDQIWVPQVFFMDFISMLDIVASFHCMQFQGKLINQTWENGEKPSFGTDFGPFGPNLGSKIFPINFTLTIWYTLLQGFIACTFKKN